MLLVRDTRRPWLEPSGDFRFRGPGGVRRTRHDRNGRPYVEARRKSAHAPDGRPRLLRVLLHRVVMSVLLGRQLSPGEMVCHRDDDKRNNFPSNLYIGDARRKAADGVRNGRRPTGDRHPAAKLSDEQVRQVRLAVAGTRGAATWRWLTVSTRAPSAGSSTESGGEPVDRGRRTLAG